MVEQPATTIRYDDIGDHLATMNAAGWRCATVTYIENAKVICLWEK